LYESIIALGTITTIEGLEDSVSKFVKEKKFLCALSNILEFAET